MGMGDYPPKEYQCHCGLKIQYLGPLPEPIFDMPILTAVGSSNGPDLDKMNLDVAPKWVCQWCGSNTGLARDFCRRCTCDLERTPPASLWWRVESLAREDIASFCFQAMHPMSADVALARLRRLETTGVFELGGNEALAAMMRPVTYWPDRFESQSTSRRKAKIPPPPPKASPQDDPATRVRREIELELAKSYNIHLSVSDEMTLAGDIGMDNLDIVELFVAVGKAIGPNTPEFKQPEECYGEITIGDLVRHYTA